VCRTFSGSQRFGNEGRNVEKALAMFRGEFNPRDRLLRGLLLSSVRSHLFNAVVAERMARGNWDRALTGEVLWLSGQWHLVAHRKPAGDEVERFEKGIVELTAPLWGQGELHSAGEVRQLELEVMGRFPERHGRTGSGGTSTRAARDPIATSEPGVCRFGWWRSPTEF